MVGVAAGGATGGWLVAGHFFILLYLGVILLFYTKMVGVVACGGWLGGFQKYYIFQNFFFVFFVFFSQPIPPIPITHHYPPHPPHYHYYVLFRLIYIKKP